MSLIFEFSVPLIVGVIVAVIWANLSPEGYHAFVDKPFVVPHPFGHLSVCFVTNEIFMVFFFGLATYGHYWVEFEFSNLLREISCGYGLNSSFAASSFFIQAQSFQSMVT
jgi:hypothetical protein